MSFEFDPPDDNDDSTFELERIQTQDTAGNQYKAEAFVRIDYDACDATAVCAEICPEDVFEVNGDHTSIVNPKACTECWLCVENCTSGAIEIG